MRLAIDLPIAPMLARLVDDIPAPDAIPGGYAYEPKWDGFRCLILRDGDQVELISRMNKQLTRYFPEVVAKVLACLPDRCVVDAEMIIRTGEPGAQRLDWDALSQRVHPSLKRVKELSRQTPAELVCFDLLALEHLNVLELPYDARREVLSELFTDLQGTGVHLTANSHDIEVARHWFSTFEGAGLDGVMIKERQGHYQPGHRAMLKVKHRRTAEAVVVGYRTHSRGHGVGSLMLGMYDERERLIPVGGIGALKGSLRDSLAQELAPLVAPEGEGLVLPAQGSRRHDPLDVGTYVALRPELVVEVSFDQLEGKRFRHAAQLVRFRPDRDPRSCLIDQVDVASAYDLGKLLGQ